MAVLSNSNAISPSGYDINNSLRFRSSASAYLNRTFTTPTNNKIFTWSGWVKIGTIPSSREAIFMACNSGATSYFGLEFNASANLCVLDQPTGGYVLVSTQVFRDPSAWYHIVMAVDTTQATGSNRIKLYVNGNQITSFSTSLTIALNVNPYMNSAVAHAIGSYNPLANYYFDGYQTECYFIDGQALTPSSFGSTNATTGVWQPAKYTGTYGTNGFYLKFSDIATTSGSNAGLGKDFSGNTNYWTTNNISVTSGTTYDAMTDSPTNTSATVANYAVLNPLDKGTSLTLSQANLSGSISTTWNIAKGTFGNSSGKWYYEFQFSGTSALIGICGEVTNLATNLGVSARDYGYQSSAAKWNNNVSTSYGASWTTGDIIGVAYDLDAGTIEFYKNGTSQGVAYSGIPAGTYFPAVSIYNSTLWTNFGQRPFSYTPPTGYKALNTYNLSDSTIKKGNSYMDAVLWTGAGQTGAGSITGLNFKPDFVWAKMRSSAISHALYNSIVGGGANKALSSNSTDSEASFNANATNGYLSSFDSNGFSYFGGSSPAYFSSNGNTYVGWAWQAGQGTNTTNTAGSITSTVSANTTAGFSIVTYTGTGANATVGHGLGVVPKFFVVKSRSSTGQNWQVYTATYGKDYVFQLDLTSAIQNYSNYWGTSNPTSGVFGVNGSYSGINANGVNYVAYCWAEIAGFSKFGSYTGNGSADGPFVFTGFRPKFVMIKRTDAVADWIVYDTSRNTYNVINTALYANASNADVVSSLLNIDVLSNGFKLRDSYANTNGSGATFIYAAFSENPFKNSLAR